MKKVCKLLLMKGDLFSEVFIDLFEERKIFLDLSLTSSDIKKLFHRDGVWLSARSIETLSKKVTGFGLDELLILYRKGSLS